MFTHGHFVKYVRVAPFEVLHAKKSSYLRVNVLFWVKAKEFQSEAIKNRIELRMDVIKLNE